MSHKRMTYSEVEEYIKNNNSNVSKKKTSLDALNLLTKNLLVKRSQRKALEIEGNEPILSINEKESF